MHPRSVVPGPLLAVAGLSSLLVLWLVLWPTSARSRSAAAAFPVGDWCGIGKAPTGEIVPTPVKGAIGRGILYFAILRHKQIGGYGQAFFTAHVEKLIGKSVNVSELRADADFTAAIGTAAAPELVGSWNIHGEVKVIQDTRTFTHPLSFQAKNWKGKLVVEKATRTVVSGHFIVPKWKWTARRRAGRACPGASP
jgi:hypothetical protein